jgi:hypothetical protein
LRYAPFVALFGIGLAMLMPSAFAQYDKPDVNATQEQLEGCKRLDIPPEQCSDNTILAKTRCLGGIGAPCGGGSTLPKLDPVVLSILIGSGAALVTGTLYVRRVRRVRKKN